MQQLSGIDSSFLSMETPTQQGHVAGVVIVDPEAAPEGWGFATIKELIASRLHLLPPFRRRLVTVPLDLDQPYWIEDPDFDLDFHLRHIAVPAPGDEAQLADLVARIHARPLVGALPEPMRVTCSPPRTKSTARARASSEARSPLAGRAPPER